MRGSQSHHLVCILSRVGLEWTFANLASAADWVPLTMGTITCLMLLIWLLLLLLLIRMIFPRVWLQVHPNRECFCCLAWMSLFLGFNLCLHVWSLYSKSKPVRGTVIFNYPTCITQAHILLLVSLTLECTFKRTSKIMLGLGLGLGEGCPYHRRF